VVFTIFQAYLAISTFVDRKHLCQMVSPTLSSELVILDVHRNCPVAVQHAGKHGNALFSESIGHFRVPPLPWYFEITFCDIKAKYVLAIPWFWASSNVHTPC
jgi:hypothetical protein